MYIIIAILGLITETAAAIIGFGDKLALIAILSFFIDIKEAIIIAAVYSLFAYSVRIFFYHKHFDKKLFIHLVPYLIVGILLGLLIFSWLPAKQLRIVFAAFLVVFAIYHLFLQKKFKLNLSRHGLSLGVLIFGLVEASVGAAGPLLAILLLQHGKRKQQFVVLVAGLLLVSSIVRLIGYASVGLLGNLNIPLICLLIAVSIAGNFIGKKLLNILPVRVFEYLVVGMLFIVAAKELFF